MKSRFYLPIATLAFATAAMIAAPAHADGAYVGGTLGVPSFPNSINGVTGSGDGVSGKLFAGYQLSPNFAVEGGIDDLGHVKNNGSGHASGHSEFVDAVGLLPLGGNFSLLGSLGVAYVNLNTSNGDDARGAAKLGLGAEYALMSNVDLRAEWERYATSEFNSHPNVDQYTVGLRVLF